jgi:hypothetical protein
MAPRANHPRGACDDVFHLLCALTLAAWAGGVGCGGLTATKGKDDSGAMVSGDAEGVADQSSEAADQASEAERPPPLSPCPSTPPAAGTSCAGDGQTCGWGDDVRGDMCRTTASCTSGLWQVTSPRAQTCPPLETIGTCPAGLTGTCKDGQICTKEGGLFCLCTHRAPTCSICSLGWYCPAAASVSYLAARGCPVAEPNFGTGCETEGAICQYFVYACGQRARVCSGGKWVPGEVLGCPT